MIKETGTKIIKDLDEIRDETEGSKALVILEDISDVQNLKGYVHAISADETSFEELCEMSTRLRENGTQNIIVGSYHYEGEGADKQSENNTIWESLKIVNDLLSDILISDNDMQHALLHTLLQENRHGEVPKELAKVISENSMKYYERTVKATEAQSMLQDVLKNPDIQSYESHKYSFDRIKKEHEELYEKMQRLYSGRISGVLFDIVDNRRVAKTIDECTKEELFDLVHEIFRTMEEAGIKYPEI